MIKLYDYFRSSASYRVRLALSLKGIKHQLQEVHLVQDGGQQHQSAYKALNPQGLVPCLQIDSMNLSQSLAILEYLEEAYPSPSLLPEKVEDKAYVRQLSYLISCDIHPLNNLRVLKYLKEELQLNDQQKSNWYQHWIKEGFTAFEALLKQYAGKYCFKDELTMADLCLIPQVYNALRFECPMEDFPKIKQIYDNCMQLNTFSAVAPE